MLLETSTEFGKITLYKGIVKRILEKTISDFSNAFYFASENGKLLNHLSKKNNDDDYFFYIDTEKKFIRVFIIFRFGISQRKTAEEFAKKIKENFKIAEIEIDKIEIYSKGILIRDRILRREIYFTY